MSQLSSNPAFVVHGTKTGRHSSLPIPKTLFPTLGSLQEVVDLAESKLPITDKNEMFSLLMSYHNTLLATFHVTTIF